MCKFKIIQSKDYVTVVNINGAYENHTHLKRMSTARMLIKLMKKKVVPKSEYLRESVKRCTLDERYIKDIDNKIAKDKNKQNYHNVGGGKR